MSALTVVDKIWNAHVVHSYADGPDVLFLDLHLIHEVTSYSAFEDLRSKQLRVAHPRLNLASAEHTVPTTSGRTMLSMSGQPGILVDALRRNCDWSGIEFHGLDSELQGIVHVIAPEQGRIHPGMTVVCGDSHTSTLGALGALAFGIGTSGVLQALATQMLILDRPKVMAIEIDGHLAPAVSAKDLILYIASEYGTAVATGFAIEFCGTAVREMSMEGRMSLCNMSIELGGRSGTISPDETTAEYLCGRPHAPATSDDTVWTAYGTEDCAEYDKQIAIDANVVVPMISFGTNPSMSVPIDAAIPKYRASRSESAEAYGRALSYMGLREGQRLEGHPIDAVFIGSCTNSRIEDLRSAAEYLAQGQVASGVRVVVVPGSAAVKAQAEREGLADVFISAGAEWHESGCSMCAGINGDILAPGQYVVSTSNRNFEGRQGAGVRTLLASPATAAASARAGFVTDPRRC